MDLFGKTITLTHKGTEDYKTAIGAVVSIFFVVSLSWYGINEFISYMQN
jgi:hypothetical protein